MLEAASNRQRSRMRNRIWAIFREAAGEGVEISRDPLGDRYVVQKFDIRVDFDTFQQAEEARERALALLIVGGWEIERENPKKVSRFTTRFTDARCRAVVDVPYELPTGGARINIGVTSFA